MNELQPGVSLYLKSGRSIRGPLTLDRLIQLRNTSRLTRSDQVSMDRVNWIEARLVPELFEPEFVITSDTHWFYNSDGVQCGPHTASELSQLAASGKFLPTDRVWHEGMKSWKPAHTVRDIRGSFDPAILRMGKSPPATTVILSIVAIVACVCVAAIFVNPNPGGTPATESFSVNGSGGHQVTAVRCPDCAGNPITKVTCPGCNGKLESNCSSCSGLGFHRCTYRREGFFGVVCKGGNLFGNNERYEGVCTSCNGKGEIRCFECKARGTVEATCPVCASTGTIENTCKTCGGQGTVMQ